MDYTNQTAINKSISSYKKALKKITDKYPVFRMGSRDHNSRSICPTDLELSYGTNNLSDATNIFCNCSDLFDYGRPIIVGPNYHILSDYFKVTFYWNEPFEIYGWNCARSDEHGKITHPKKLVKFATGSVGLKLAEKRWGLKNWKENYEKIGEFAAQLKEGVRQEFLTNIENANKQVIKWEVTIQSSIQNCAIT